jgi:hypothetical protein
MKTLAAATSFLILGALACALMASCAEPPRPANSAQNPSGAAPGDPVADPSAASNKDGGGGGGW